jgi:hypothetical protein
MPGGGRGCRLAGAVDGRARRLGHGDRHRHPVRRAARLRHEHLSERRQILDRLSAALRPGGWLVIEDYDWTGFGFEDADPLFERAGEAVMTFMRHAGFEPYHGRRVVDDMAAAGLVDVRGEGRSRVVDSAGFDFFRLSIESLRNAVVDAGLLAREDADAGAARFSENRRLFTPVMMAGIGRRP